MAIYRKLSFIFSTYVTLSIRFEYPRIFYTVFPRQIVKAPAITPSISLTPFLDSVLTCPPGPSPVSRRLLPVASAPNGDESSAPQLPPTDPLVFASECVGAFVPPTEAHIHFLKQAHAMFLFLDDKYDDVDESQRAAFKVFEVRSAVGRSADESIIATRQWRNIAMVSSRCDTRKTQFRCLEYQAASFSHGFTQNIVENIVSTALICCFACFLPPCSAHRPPPSVGVQPAPADRARSQRDSDRVAVDRRHRTPVAVRAQVGDLEGVSERADRDAAKSKAVRENGQSYGTNHLLSSKHNHLLSSKQLDKIRGQEHLPLFFHESCGNECFLPG
jgi:hypothetical protein